MKRIIRTLVVAIMMIATCATAFAQQNTPQRPNKKQRISREQLAEIQAKHIASELAFGDAVTERFVKTYCDCQKEIWALGPRQRPNKQGSTEEQNEERIKQRFDMSEKILDIRKKYYKAYSKFLTQAQIEKVYEQERKMMNRLAKRRHAKPTRKMNNQ
ncbi:MAG TPA: hypothetical protein DEQ17_04845 [Prevotella sp.]|nr:hypothetical protein [Prevotella sp.]